VRYFLHLILVFELVACGSTAALAPPVAVGGTVTAVPAGTTNAQAEQIVFTAKSTYRGVLTLAVAYKNLRPCGAGVAQPCSDPAIVAQLQKADTVAAGALDAAEAIVRVPTVGTTARDMAIQTANSALAALSALVTSIGVH
jgi:hypothetical protein